MTELTIEGLILGIGYLAIFGCMFTNGLSGLPSSPFVYVTAGFLIPTGQLDWAPVLFWGTFGNVLGNIALYELTRRKGFDWVMRRSGYLRRYESVATKLRKGFEKRGIRIVCIGKFIPMVKVVIPIVAGVAQMQRKLFALLVAATSFFWAFGSVGYGFYFGKAVETKNFTLVTTFMFVVTAFVLWWFFQYIKRIPLEE